jgi:hypothetical protein
MYFRIGVHPLHLMSVERICLQEVGVGYVTWRTDHTFCCVDDTLWKAFPATVALRRRVSGAVVHQALAEDVAVTSHAIKCHVFRVLQRYSPATKLILMLHPTCPSTAFTHLHTCSCLCVFHGSVWPKSHPVSTRVLRMKI